VKIAFVLVLGAAILVIFIPRPWIDPTLFQAGLFLLGCAGSIASIFRPQKLRLSFPMVPLACAAAWGVVQIAAHWTAAPADTRFAVLTWFANLVAFSLALQLGRRFLDALLYFAFALSVVAAVQYFSGVPKIFWFFPTDAPAWGPFVNRDQYAAFIELMLPLALVRAFDREARFSAIAAAMYASVIAGASRAGAILTTAEIVFVQLRGRQFRPRLWLLAAVFVAVGGWSMLAHRFSDRDLLGGRREILESTIAMIHARPWTGFGLGTFHTAYPAYASRDFGAAVNHAHNDWAEWAADGGIPFCLLMVAVAVWSVPKALRSVWGIGIVAVFIHGMADFPLHQPALELWWFALLGGLAAETISGPG